jgi:serine/threonine protein kinase
MDRVELIDGELVIVMELADRSLHDLLGECRAAGLPGIPRVELLRYLEETAEVLDLLNQEHGLQHLDVKPRNLFLVGRHVKVGDFGLVNSLAELSGSTPSALQMGAGTPLYAAPECFLGRVTLFSDQYSLAIAYHELLTGEPPFVGKNFRQVALQHMQAEPDLGRLPAADRPVVGRALSKDARRRFPSCTAFVEALRSGAIDAPIGPPSSAPRRPKAATRTDIPIVDLAATPVVPPRGESDKIDPQATRETREVASTNRTPPESLRPSAAPRVEAALPPPLEFGRDPLEGCQFLDCVARNPAGETWTARTADGRDRLIRFVVGLDFSNGRKEVEGLARLRAIRHDALEPMELIGGGDHRLAILTDGCPTTLASRFAECQAAGLPGVPREELLGRLSETTQALDSLLKSYGVRHLGLNSRCLLLRNGRLRILHFGLIELIHMPTGCSPAALYPRYAAPELFEGRPHATSDIYSLALIYYEMLTGAHPFHALSQRQMTSVRHRWRPDLDLAPAPDRAVLEIALHPDPARRYATGADFVAALTREPRRAGSRTMNAPIPGMTSDVELTPTTRSLMRQAINRLVAVAAGELEVREHQNIRYLLHPGKYLAHEFFARLPPGVGRLRLDGFRQEWRASPMRADGPGVAYLVSLSSGSWQRLWRMQPGLKVLIEMAPPAPPAALTEITVRLEPVRCGADAERILEELGPQLLKSLREHCQALPERRNQARLRFEQPVRVAPVLDGRDLGDEILSQAKDISLRGMGLVMPCRPPSMLLSIRLPAETLGQEIDIPGCIVRAAPRADGRYELGVRFLVDESNK